MKRILICAAIVAVTSSESKAQINVNYTINIAPSNDTISPFIYGTNRGGFSASTLHRCSHARMSTYNWENNACNSGNGNGNMNDNYLMNRFSIPQSDWYKPGILATAIQDTAIKYGAQSLIAIPMLSYVSADRNGTAVLATEVAPSNRWKQNITIKSGTLQLQPDSTDGAVYSNEYVNFLISKYGFSTTATGIKNYALDSRPSNWRNTFFLAHPDTNTCIEVIQKSIALAKCIKNLDANAKIFGGEFDGFSDYYNTKQAADWKDMHELHYPNHMSLFLDSMKKASTYAGKRLLDVVTFQYYPSSNLGWLGGSDTSLFFCAERVQAPRSLWDSSYVENSWIGTYYANELPILKPMHTAINYYYPGTQLGITEYSFGADAHISGGLAIAEALMAFIKSNVAYACKADKAQQYSLSAMNLFRAVPQPFALLNLAAESNNRWSSNIVASAADAANSELHFVVSNKDFYSSIAANFLFSAAQKFDSLWVYNFQANSTAINSSFLPLNGGAINSYQYTLAPASVYHFVFKKKAVPTSLSAIEANPIHIFPNPCSNRITLRGGSGNKLCVYSLQGQVVDCSFEKKSGAIEINTEKLVPGIYVLHAGNKQLQFVKN